MSTNRRLRLIGANSLPSQEDPIFAAIERHRAAYMKQMESGRLDEGDSSTAQGLAAAAIWRADVAAADSAAEALIELATCATDRGIVALIEYIEAFNQGSHFLADDPDYGASRPMFWPDIDAHEDDDGHAGASFAWALLASIKRRARLGSAGKAVAS